MTGKQKKKKKECDARRTTSAKKKKKKKKKKPAKVAVISFRADVELARRIDKHVVRLFSEAPGGSWTRSSAALNLVLRALDAIESTP